VIDQATVEFAGGEIVLWNDDGVLMLKHAERMAIRSNSTSIKPWNLANSS